ncbi:MAG TPA: tetratricopeptide repeat protein [Rhodocyclaceae bacterium]|jgi:Flp pilus assembly protein TadD
MNIRLLLSMVLVLMLGGCTAAVSTAIKSLDNDQDIVSINREAELAYESGEAAKAEALYKNLVRRMPNDGETWMRLGNLYARNNRPEEAAAAYQKALSINGGEARAWNNLGVVRLRQAWAALIQAQATAEAKSGLSSQVDATLEHLSKLPMLEAEVRVPNGIKVVPQP